MDWNGNRLSPNAQILQHGLAIANRHMLEMAAALGRDLVIGSLDGGYAERSAAELLEETRRSEWWHEHFDE